MAEDVYSFGEWVRLRRQSLVLSREELARQVGVAEISIRKIEADERRPSPQVAALLAQQLQLAAETHALFVQVARGLLAVDQLPPPIPGSPRADSATLTTPAPAPLPSGTVTFLFTDIVGSTRLWEQHPQAMAAALARHDALIQHAIAANSGQVFKTGGDAICAVFARAPDALAAALAAQRALQAEAWGATGPLRVRIALHTGVAEERGGDYFGPPLNRVARLLAAGHGGQILLSLAAEQLARDHLPHDITLRDLGSHRLKDLSYPEQIFQLVVPDLPADFPPLNTLNARRTNLPAQPTALIGREEDIAAVCARLRRDDLRLVTLTGPGGTGKTRLGLQAANELIGEFADGVYFVNLAPINDPALVLSTIMQALKVSEISDQPAQERLQSYLSDKQLLLLLDNFEQVVEAAPGIADLLAACPQLKTLVTSRVLLRLRGEREYAVPPLALPPTGDQRSTTDRAGDPSSIVTQYAAIQLFIQRALDVQPNFVVTNDNAPAVAEICARLDGLPLAIELAAARAKLFAPEALLARLSNRLALLTGGARDLPARQQTLRGAIAWSYDLLEPGTQTLFQRLGVFMGGSTLEAATAVCSVHADHVLDVLDQLELLVDSSLLLRVDGADGEPRFVMLETIREYALERLEACGEVEVVRQWHAEYFLRLAEEADMHLQHAGQRRWLDRLEIEYNNLLAALMWALGGGNAEIGARLVLALVGRRLSAQGFWKARGYGSERYWLEAALNQSKEITLVIRAMLITRSLVLIGGTFEDAQAGAMYAETLATFRAVGDTSGLALALLHRGHGLWNTQDPDYSQATQLLEEALMLYRELGEYHGIGAALHGLGNIARDSGDLERAVGLLEESVDIFRNLDANEVELGLALNGLGDVLLLQDGGARATALWWEAVQLMQALGDRYPALWPIRNLAWRALVAGGDAQVLMLLEDQVAWLRDKREDGSLAYVLHLLGMLEGIQRDDTRGRALLREALLIQQIDASHLLKESLDGFAWLAANQRHWTRAARLLGATELMFMHDFIGWRFAHKHFVTTVRVQLTEAAFARAWAEGQALTLEQAIVEALRL